jgi:hypothetical protein
VDDGLDTCLAFMLLSLGEMTRREMRMCRFRIQTIKSVVFGKQLLFSYYQESHTL